MGGNLDLTRVRVFPSAFQKAEGICEEVIVMVD